MKLSFLYDQTIRENFKSQKQRFIQQGIEPEIVKAYFEKFKHIKDKDYKELKHEIHGVDLPVDRRNDIDAYKNFHELELVVDYVGGQRDVSTAMGGTDIEVDGKPVYEDANFEVYYADSPRACIKYKGKIPYSWCVARSDASNMFYTYRFKPYEPAFYFVKDKKAADKEFKAWNMVKNVFKGKFLNKYHFFVIQVPKNTDPEKNDQKQFIVTSANNDGDEQMSWDEILKLTNPKIGSIKEVLQPKPFSKEERKQHERFKSGIGDNEFSRLSYGDKRNYLDIYPTIGKAISDHQLQALPDDLMNLYVSFGIGLSENQHKFVESQKPKVMKRYVQITRRKFEEYMEKDGYNRRQLMLNFSEGKTLGDEDFTKFIKTLDKSSLNEYLHQGGWESIEYLKKHYSERLESGDKVGLELLQQLPMAGENDNTKVLKKIHEMLPEGVKIISNGEEVTIDVNALVSDDIWRTFEVHDDVQWVYEGSHDFGTRYDYDSYFDGYGEGLTEELDSNIEAIIKDNSSLMEDIRAVGVEVDLEHIKALISEDGLDEIENTIDSEWGNAHNEAEYEAGDKYYDKMNALISVDTHYNEIKINKRAFLIYVHTTGSYEFFTTDEGEFTSTITELLEEIFGAFGFPSEYYQLDEVVRDEAYGNVHVDTDTIISTIEEKIEQGLAEYLDDNSDDEDDEDYDSGSSRMEKLKVNVIDLLKTTLKAVGQDENATHIENELVRIDIDRGKFKLNGSVYVDIFDKEHDKRHGGYVKIKDLPTYFQNYKLLETINKFQRLIK